VVDDFFRVKCLEVSRVLTEFEVHLGRAVEIFRMMSVWWSKRGVLLAYLFLFLNRYLQLASRVQSSPVVSMMNGVGLRKLTEL
jgi:hypothetical protein